MRKTTTRCAVLMAILSVFSGCSPPDDSTNSTPDSASAVVQEESSEVVFRGRYFLSKECRQGAHGEYALGLWGVCEVVEVLEGELKLERLLDVHVPEDVVEGLNYTFRWKPSDSERERLRKAREGGFTGIWLDGKTLEVVRARESDH